MNVERCTPCTFWNKSKNQKKLICTGTCKLLYMRFTGYIINRRTSATASPCEFSLVFSTSTLYEFHKLLQYVLSIHEVKAIHLTIVFPWPVLARTACTRPWSSEQAKVTAVLAASLLELHEQHCNNSTKFQFRCGAMKSSTHDWTELFIWEAYTVHNIAHIVVGSARHDRSIVRLKCGLTYQRLALFIRQWSLIDQLEACGANTLSRSRTDEKIQSPIIYITMFRKAVDLGQQVKECREILWCLLMLMNNYGTVVEIRMIPASTFFRDDHTQFFYDDSSSRSTATNVEVLSVCWHHEYILCSLLFIFVSFQVIYDGPRSRIVQSPCNKAVTFFLEKGFVVRLQTFE